jgi:uncharacterized membrane protein HdeD (DUF308 family)
MKHILLLPLFSLSYQDLRSKEVDVITLGIFVALSLLGNQKETFLVCFSVLSLIYFLSNKMMLADLMVICGCANFIALEHLGIFWTLMGVQGVIYAFWKRNKEIPMIPFITTSFIVCSLL